jgi:hypothetical protein
MFFEVVWVLGGIGYCSSLLAWRGNDNWTALCSYQLIDFASVDFQAIEFNALFCPTPTYNFDIAVRDTGRVKVFLSYSRCMLAIAVCSQPAAFIAGVLASTGALRIPV